MPFQCGCVTRFFTFLFTVFVFTLSSISQGQAAVSQLAWLQGSEMESGSRLIDFVDPESVSWNETTSIDPRFFDKIFELFSRLDPQIDGTGIGLALSKRIIEVHGGKMWVESEGIGRGTTFYFTISKKLAETQK